MCLIKFSVLGPKCTTKSSNWGFIFRYKMAHEVMFRNIMPNANFSYDDYG
jgi:hypothetical protein